MTDQVWLSILSILMLIITSAFGWFFKMLFAKLSALEANSQNTALAAFLGRDVEREKSWTLWRETVDRRLDSKRADIKDLDHRVTRLERNGIK